MRMEVADGVSKSCAVQHVYKQLEKGATIQTKTSDNYKKVGQPGENEGWLKQAELFLKTQRLGNNMAGEIQWKRM